MTHRVTVLLLEPVVGFDATIPSQLLGAAIDEDGTPQYRVTMAGLRAGVVRTEVDYDIGVPAGPEALATADTVIVPGTRMPGPRWDGTLPAELAAALARIRPGTRMVSICTGSFVLAAAGLLDGRPATTHWAHAAEFRRLYPAVELDEGRLFVDDGDLLSSAGLAAGIDLCLHLIRRDHGAAMANRVARQCVVPPWREGGQAQFIEQAMPLGDSPATTRTREWALGNLERRLDVAALAAHARLSVRTFNRRFREETGQAPGAWLLAQRIARARMLLETTDLAVDAVAAAAGLGTGASLRQHLRASLGVSPSDYRRTFRGADLVGQPG
ncbi:MAG TPA: helix-turn-helix domain-containing protein [Jatrophihabitans sp.]|nr:helix-turn-helix domain-containing protein [Jatrophihabitans sp.]